MDRALLYIYYGGFSWEFLLCLRVMRGRREAGAM